MYGATTDQQTQRLRILHRPYTRTRVQGQGYLKGEGRSCLNGRQALPRPRPGTYLPLSAFLKFGLFAAS
jgi:hypothetical protein